MIALLSEFIKIGPRISLYTPSKSTTGQLIIVCTRLGAARKNIIKYIAIYQNLAPEARILLIESDVQIITSRYKKQRKLITPAISVVLDTLAECGYYHNTDGGTTSEDGQYYNLVSSSSSSMRIKTLPRILLHMFSNGGTNSATQLLIVLHEHLGQPLLIIGQLFDSCPAKGTYWKSHTAMALSLRPKGVISRFWGAVVVHCILIMLYMWIAWGNDNPATLMRRTLLDEKMLADPYSDGNLVNGRACYLFSKADEQVDWIDIKDHVQEAREKGWTVREIVFEGSGHCAHLSKNGVRYAEAMRDMWLNVGKPKLWKVFEASNASSS